MRPVHTGIHQWGPPDDGLRYCEVCGWSEFSITGHSCAGIRGILGRVTEDQDLTGRGIASEPRLGVAPDALTNGSDLRTAAPRPVKTRRRSISPASPDQRFKARGSACVACGLTSLEITIDPAHLIPRGMTTIGQDDERAVVPLCRRCHNAYDQENLDLASCLEPGYREEVAFAVARVGLFAALRRITNRRWTTEDAA